MIRPSRRHISHPAGRTRPSRVSQSDLFPRRSRCRAVYSKPCRRRNRHSRFARLVGRSTMVRWAVTSARAATLLGWTEIDVWVNHELAEQGELAVEQRLIEDNLTRRNL